METIAYITIDKTKWGEGPWRQESDKIQFPDPATALPCLMVRGPGGHWCGYVGVNPGHPWHGTDYNGMGWDDEDAPEQKVSVHGGLTYSGACQETKDETTGVCHKPGPGETDNVWWFGFDCAHAGDYSPSMAEYLPKNLTRYDGVDDNPPWPAETYKTVNYVRDEITSLAKQLQEVEVAHRKELPACTR